MSTGGAPLPKTMLLASGSQQQRLNIAEGNNDTIEEEEDSSAHQTSMSEQSIMVKKTNQSKGVKMDFGEVDDQHGSLADVFRQKKQQMLQDRLMQKTHTDGVREEKKKGGKTKEELIELRK